MSGDRGVIRLQLNTRNLSYIVPHQVGDDVRSLQFALTKFLGFTIPEDEIREGFFGIGTHKAVVELQKKYGLNCSNCTAGLIDNFTAELITEEVNKLPSIDQSKQFVVRGVVHNEDGVPADNVIVRAVDKDLRQEDELGMTITDTQGKYEISYSSSQFTRAEKKSADLTVRVYRREEEKEQALVTSPIMFNAPRMVTIDLTIGDRQYGGISEYETILNEIRPLVQGVGWDQITENKEIQDITFLTSETGLSRQKIEFLVAAKKLSQTTRLPPEALYGLFCGNLPTNLSDLLSTSLTAYRHALEIALRNNIIPSKVHKDLDRIIERLKELKIEHAFKEPAEKGRKISLGTLLGSSIRSQDENQRNMLIEEFLTLYLKYQEESKPIQEFWKDLRENHPNLKEHVENLQLTIQFSAILHNHWPLIRRVQAMQHEGKVNSLRDLARLDKEDWIAIMHSKSDEDDSNIIGSPQDIIGEGDKEKIKNYASTIVRIIEDTFPTAVFARRLEKHNLPDNRDLVTFFNNNSSFDLRRDYVEKYLRDKPESTNGIADKEVFKTQLKKYQRIFKLTPDYEELSILVGDGLESAHAISKMGKNVFVKKYSQSLGSEQRADKIYENALRVS